MSDSDLHPPEESQPPYVSGIGNLEHWILELRRRAHDIGNHATRVEGLVAIERVRVDEILKEQGRQEEREKTRDNKVDRITNWQNRMIGALALIAFLFPTTIGTLVAVLK